jgi:4-hydroxy-tetrahydrodipicolinate synthase
MEGVYSVIPTPFLKNLDVDHESLRKVVDLAVKAGVTGITALGVTAEVARLNETERANILETVLKHVNGRPVVAGATSDGLRTCIENCRQAKAAGAAAVMVSPPRMPKINSDAVFRHFASLADAVDIPIVVQDYPPISGYAMEPWLLARIAKEIPAARTIKLEDPPTPFKTTRILEQSGDIKISIFGGLGGVFLLEELMAGGAGAMTGFAYPEILVKIVSAYKKGDIERAGQIFYRFVPLMRFEFQEGIGMAIRKEVLRRRGVLSDPSTRAPGARLDEKTLAALDRILRWTASQEDGDCIAV